MFKLIKTLNSTKCAPEIVEIRLDANTVVYKYHLYYYQIGSLSTMKERDSAGLFVPIEDKPKTTESKIVRGFFVTPDMVFECDTVIGDEIEENLPWRAGKWVSLYEDPYTHSYVGITGPIDEWGAFIIDAEDYAEHGTMLVKFKTC